MVVTALSALAIVAARALGLSTLLQVDGPVLNPEDLPCLDIRAGSKSISAGFASASFASFPSRPPGPFANFEDADANANRRNLPTVITG